MNQVKAPCSSCVRETTHNVLHVVGYEVDDDRHDVFSMLQCAGCQSVSMSRQVIFKSDDDVELTYYPSPVSRKKPSWLLSLAIGWVGKEGEDALGDLLYEIYQAVDGGQYRLAAMGIRALLEQVMIAKVGDLKTFEQKLDAFQEKGFISLIQRDAMTETLEIGHAAMHRAFKPTEKELNVALDIVEGIFAAIYDHAEASSKLTKRVPTRTPRK
jgi:hypothetical protein